MFLRNESLVSKKLFVSRIQINYLSDNCNKSSDFYVFYQVIKSPSLIYFNYHLNKHTNVRINYSSVFLFVIIFTLIIFSLILENMREIYLFSTFHYIKRVIILLLFEKHLDLIYVKLKFRINISITDINTYE